MFHKLMPILLLVLFTGCLDSPLDSPMAQASTVVEPKASPGKTATRPENLVSVFRSDDLGRSWVPLGYGLPEDLLATHLERWGNQLVLGSSNYGVYLSNPGNQSWQQLDTTTLPSTNINNLYVAEGVIYAGVRKQGIYASKDLGKSWVSLNHDLKSPTVKSILRTGKEVWVGTDEGIFALQDGSKTWRQITDKPQMQGLLMVGESFIAGTYNGIVISNDHGKTWKVVNKDIMPTKIALVDGNFMAMDIDQGAFLSADMGKTWKPMQEGIANETQVFEIVKVGDELLRSQPDGLYLSKDGGAKWQDIYHFSFDVPFGVMLRTGKQWNEVYSRPEAPMVDFIVVDGVVFGATVRGC